MSRGGWCWAGVWLAGCTLPPLDSATGEPVQILETTRRCEDGLREWIVQTRGWTQGGLVRLQGMGRSEQHAIPSVAADPVTGEDRLRLVVELVADPEAWEAGRRTGFLCGDEVAERLDVWGWQGASGDCVSDAAWQSDEEDPCDSPW